MIKPDDIPDWAWESARMLCDQYEFDREAIARALIAAHRRGAEEERERCAKVAFDTINDMRGSGESDLRSARARVDDAIRNPVTGGSR